MDEEVMEQFAAEDDPYSHVMGQITKALDWGKDHTGGMSEIEVDILNALRLVIIRGDVDSAGMLRPEE